MEWYALNEYLEILKKTRDMSQRFRSRTLIVILERSSSAGALAGTEIIYVATAQTNSNANIRTLLASISIPSQLTLSRSPLAKRMARAARVLVQQSQVMQSRM